MNNKFPYISRSGVAIGIRIGAKVIQQPTSLLGTIALVFDDGGTIYSLTFNDSATETILMI